MKLKLSQIVQINQIFEEFSDSPLTIKTSYKIMKVLEQLQKDSNFFKEKLAELINKYGERDSNNQLIIQNDSYKIKDEDKEKFDNDYYELQGIENELNLETFTLDELEELKLSPKKLFIIKNLISD